jgi:hypothetical protein
MPPFKRERESEEEEKYISNGMRSFIFQKNNTRLQSTVAQTIVGGVVDDQKNSESSNLALNTTNVRVCAHTFGTIASIFIQCSQISKCQ